MKKRTILNTAIACGAAVCFSLQSCNNTATLKPAKISSIQADTLVSLKAGDEASPKCKVSIDYMYLEPGDENDSISAIINSRLQSIAFGDAYSKMSSKEAIPALVGKYVGNYRKELTKFYEADLHNGVKPGDIPAWYNYEYEITSELNLNNDSIWNFSVNTFRDTGGAHPNTTIKWANLLAESGKVLTKDLVFRKDKEKEIIDLVTTAANHLAEAEERARIMLKISSETEVRDKAMRSLGILGSAYTMSAPEMLQLVTWAKIGAYYGFVSVDCAKLDELSKQLLPAAVSEAASRSSADPDVYRAEILRNALQ